MTASAKQTPAADTVRPRRWSRVLRPVFTAAILLAAVWFIDFRAVLRTIASMPATVVLLALAVCAADRLLMAAKWLQLIRLAGGRARFGSIVGVYYQAAFVTDVSS